MKKNTPFWDASLPIEKRLDWLMAEMTIEEKLSCLSSRMPALERLGIPAMSVGGEAAHGIEGRNDQNELGAPDISTSFVQPIGMSASWDTDLIRQAGEVTGIEGRVIYHRHPDRGLSRWAPTVDLERDPRWGRNEEGYGEDPLLTGEMASAYIRGMQGDDPKFLRVAATLKHFYGNNTEQGRGWKNSSIDPRNKYELYLEPFRRCIEKGPAEGIMTAYNKINGIPGVLNREVQDILKDQYGLKHAVSDGGAMALVAAIHHYYGMDAESIANAIKAGVDAMSDDPTAVEAAAKEAWDLGLLSEEDIDRALRNVFRTRLRLGIYDEPVMNPYDAVTEEDIDSSKNRAICRQMSREAVCLLKNEGGVLPLDAALNAKDIALIGPMADAWYQDWYGGTPPFTTTLKEGVEEILGCEVDAADGLDRVTLTVVHNDKDMGIAIGEDGALILSDEPEIFIRQDWGEGSITYRSVHTGKYMNTRLYPDKDKSQDIGLIAAEKDAAFDWFVMEIFHEQPCENGNVVLANRFGSPVQVCEDGHLRSMLPGDGAQFRIKVVEAGIDKACRLAEQKKIVVLALGCSSMINAKEEVDRSTIDLPPAQEALLEAIYKVNPNTVLVLFSNYPYAIRTAQDRLPAILWSATGAQDMGAAMAETLFGKSAPAGRLNMTWYENDSQLPPIDNYDIIKYGRTYRYFEGKVLYPFGYGLTYTSFDYSNLRLVLTDNTKIKVTFDVKNTGSCTSDEVAQVYGIAPASRVKKPLRQLLGFCRLKNMTPGECRTVEWFVPVNELQFYDVISGTMMVEQGCYTIYAGPSSTDATLSGKIEIPGVNTGVRCLNQRIQADHYDDYENIELTEGQYGFSAAMPACTDQRAELVYRDCVLDEEAAALYLHAKSEHSGTIEIWINDQQCASWEGDTGSYERNPRPAMGEAAKAEEIARKSTWLPVYADIRFQLRDSAAAAGGRIQPIPGQTIGAASEKTLDVFKQLGLKAGQPFTLKIVLTGDVKLCWFRAEKK